FQRFNFDVALNRADRQKRMRVRAIEYGEMTPSARHRNIHMMEKLLEARVAIHTGSAAQEAIDHAVCRSEKLPEDDGFELQPFGVADVKNTRRIQHGCQVPAFCFVENKDGAARSEIAHGFENSLFFGSNLDRRGTLSHDVFKADFS